MKRSALFSRRLASLRITERWRTLLRPPASHHALDACQIADPHTRGASRGAHHRFDRVRLPLANLKYHFTIVRQPSRKPFGDPAIELHPIAATLERNARLEVAHLRRQRGKVVLRDVR